MENCLLEAVFGHKRFSRLCSPRKAQKGHGPEVTYSTAHTCAIEYMSTSAPEDNSQITFSSFAEWGADENAHLQSDHLADDGAAHNTKADESDEELTDSATKHQAAGDTSTPFHPSLTATLP